ncbi:NACHT, LRR and PYD domains-containing protein 3-like isoform X2 [Rana temporaria]|uniref:NACHT, LRR and PYD domains-containing protein 3-like isoform X2 n=1 Tax=Rana temporaria TaxID=8407 RepID=UPI001AAD6DF0|nr:NACHT, LRR and PYD domains-containing protein 3-like isoform X2 [Rana temporaria]
MDDGSGSMEGTFLPEICKGESLRDLSSDSPHLSLSVQFLFGLLNENQVKTFSEISGIPVSLRAKPAIIEWAMKDIDQTFPTQTIFCLYETQDEDFIRRVMSRCSDLILYGSRTDHLWMDRNYSNQLSYCLKALKRESFQSLYFLYLTLGPEFQKILSPFLHRSQKVRFEDCTFSSKDCLGENKAEDEEESSSSGDNMDFANLSFLMNPESKIQILYLFGCDLTSSCCDALRSILVTNRSLTRLDLSDNNLQDSGIQLLCEGLRQPGCTLQELSFVWCGVTSSGCDDLHSILITNRSLITLDLSYNDLQDNGIKCLCEGLRHPGCTLQEISFVGCNGTLSCCDDLCSIINTNQTLTRLDIKLDDDGKMSDSEVGGCFEVLRNAGFTVDRWGQNWFVSIDRRRVEHGLGEDVSSDAGNTRLLPLLENTRLLPLSEDEDSTD